MVQVAADISCGTAKPIICDEEGSLDPARWRGSVDSLGEDYAAVQRYHENRILHVQEHRGQVEIRGRDRVGVVRLPSGRRILIRTKVPGLVLLEWLVYLGEFPDIQLWARDGNVSQSDSYQSVLAGLFLRELETVTRCHMRMGFVQFDAESPEVRGRILSHRLAQRPWRLPAIPQTVRGRSINTPANQMLAAALDRILMFVGELENHQLAAFHQLRHSWSGVSRSSQDREYIIQSSMSAPPAGYRSALQLARLILTGATFDPTPGWGGDAFTISLARMWENAVNKMCCDLSAETGWHVAPRNESIRRWDDAIGADDPNRSMIADTLLCRGDQRWILDAKYKRSFGDESRNDRFQMCGYILGFGANRATLVYPVASDDVKPCRMLLSTQLEDTPIKVDSVALPMTGGPRQCKEQLSKLLGEDRNCQITSVAEAEDRRCALSAPS
jgi:5-methylcytosine-specific restriction endonuclease McrBC regulatory subunit McrC